MIFGYGRTSTIEQVAGLEAQIRDLKAAGAEKLFRENVSSVAPRKQLEAAIEFTREGDTLVVKQAPVAPPVARVSTRPQVSA
jgi:DNA invertase Pin-like site-specific DNA recombinase